MVRCFLIDDDADDREIFSIALRGLALETELHTASNGVEGIQILKDQKDFKPDFVFLDLNMPKMSGKECLLEIRRMPHLDVIPVIIYSTSTQENDIEETKEMGAKHFLPKPVRIKDLEISLRFILQKEAVEYLVNPKS